MNLIIHLANSTTKFVTWLKRKQRIKPKTDIVKVNIGCGLSIADGWLNLDIDPQALVANMPSIIIRLYYRISSAKQHYTENEYVNLLKHHIFIHHNLVYGLPFSDNSIDYIYSSHLLEHLFKDDATKLMKEAYRVLKKGGVIRIAVPDLEHMPDSLFPTSESVDYFSRHRYMYDFGTLKNLLLGAGFVGIERCNYKQGKCPDIDNLDNRPDNTLFVEAIVGGGKKNE